MTSFAILPAAGSSRRMGTAKLLLPWGPWTVIEQVLWAWQRSRVSRVVVVMSAGERELAELCRRSDADLVLPAEPTADMRASVLEGLRHVRQQCHPADSDVWLVAPADMPLLTAALIDRVLDAGQRDPGRIVVPSSGGRRGHPVLFPWPLAAQAEQLAADEGLNRLVERHPPLEIGDAGEAALADLDTAEDYRRLHDLYNPQGTPPRPR